MQCVALGHTHSVIGHLRIDRAVHAVRAFCA
jgi:hypothetical protein